MHGTKATAIVLAVMGLAVCASTVSAQAQCDSFKPSQTQFWTGWLDYNGGAYTKNDDTIMWRVSPERRGWAWFDITGKPTFIDDRNRSHHALSPESLE
jgi:hypothetical protein